MDWELIIKKTKKVFLIAVLVMFASFYFYQHADSTYQNDSEGLAVSRILAAQLGFEVDTKGFGLGHLESTKDPSLDIYTLIGLPGKLEEGYEYSLYTSQVGLQGIVYSVVAKGVTNLKLYTYFRLASCMLLAGTLFAIMWQLHKRYGILFAAVFGVITFGSPWVVNFSRNLYWVEFTWYLPMLIGLLFLNYEKKRKVIYPLFSVVLFIKCLCGYEYISTIMMTAIMFMIAEWICNKEKRKELTKNIFFVGVFCLIGFILALVVHAGIYSDGSLVEGFKDIWKNLVQRRTFGEAEEFDAVYTDSLNASIFDVLKMYFWSSGVFFYGKRMLLLLVTATTALIYQRAILKEKNVFEISLFLVSLFATVSWFVLGKAHSYIHTHMNFAMFYMGWAQISMYIICKAILGKKKIELLIDGKTKEV